MQVSNVDPYILHAHRNLYLILTPLQDGESESQIEDLFNSSTLEIKIDGKSFSKSNDRVTDKTYGKAVFARKVVEEMAAEIDFDGFIPLLDRIAKVIEVHYAQRKR